MSREIFASEIPGPMIVRLGTLLEKEARGKWHFHILFPECSFNGTGKFVFLLENELRKEYFVSYFDKMPAKEGKALLLKRHGKGALKTGRASKSLPPLVAQMAARMRELSNAQVAWHHHVCAPSCVLFGNGRWAIVFEDPLTKKRTIYQSAKEPLSEIAEIERLYYKKRKT